MSRGKISLALVDDNESVRKSFQSLLEFAGYAVHVYKDAESFLEAEPFNSTLNNQDLSAANSDRGQSGGSVFGTRLACLIVDLNLPGMNGFQLVRRVRDCGNDVPVLMISGIPDSDVHCSEQNLGNTICLNKPVLPADFLSIVAKIIEQGSSSLTPIPECDR